MKFTGVRKLALGYGFLVASTGIALVVVLRSSSPDWIGLAAFTAAQASGMLSLMVGFNAEYKSGSVHSGPAPAKPQEPQQ